MQTLPGQTDRTPQLGFLRKEHPGLLLEGVPGWRKDFHPCPSVPELIGLLLLAHQHRMHASQRPLSLLRCLSLSCNV
jgi:hypothetical protein